MSWRMPFCGTGCRGVESLQVRHYLPVVADDRRAASIAHDHDLNLRRDVPATIRTNMRLWVACFPVDVLQRLSQGANLSIVK